VDRGPVSHPDQQPTPKPKPTKPVHEPQGNPQGTPQDGPKGGEDTGHQGESGGPPDKENAHKPENGLAEPPGQSEGHSGQGPATDQAPDDEGGNVPAAVGGTGYEGKTANGPSGEPPSGTPNGAPTDTGMAQHPDRRAASAVLPDQEPGSGTRSTEELSYRPAKTAAARTEDLVGPAGHSRAVEAASPAAPAGGERPPDGYGVRAALEAPLGSTEYFFGYLWDGSSFSVQRDQQTGLGLMRDGARGFVADTSHGGALTQRAPPLPIPSPFSGFGLTMGGLAFSASSSGDGDGPLLAVIFLCLSAILWRGRSRAYGALLRAGTVPPLALERPG